MCSASYSDAETDVNEMFEEANRLAATANRLAV